jgi:uncharacterized protein YkwD
MTMQTTPQPRRLLQLFIAILVFFGSGFTRQAGSLNFSAYDVIAAVNNLRSSGGLPVLQVNGSLMAAAQAHSEYQAAGHQSSHADASGGNVTNRVAASGYSSGAEFLAGENVAALTLGTDNSVSIIVNEIWADGVHRGAMLNPKYTDIGVGVASDEEMVYITLNVAGLKAGASPVSTIQNPETPASTLPPILARVTSTPMSDGTVYHVVGYGQTLGTIAGMYGVSIQQIVDANAIDPDKIYAGQRLWIKKAVIPTITPTPESTQTSLPTFTMLPIKPTVPAPTITPTSTVTPLPAEGTDINTRELGIGLIFVLLVGFLLYLLINNTTKSEQG